MFGKIIYYDKKTIDEYKSIIKGKKQYDVEEVEIANDKGVGIDLKGISADAKAHKKYNATPVESMLYDCDEFEKMLEKRNEDDYFDFTQTDNFDIETVERGCIVKLDAYIEIPDGFDIMQLIEVFKPIIISSMSSDNEIENEALNTIMGTAKAAKVPLIVNIDEHLLCSKLNNENLIADYNDLLDADEEFTILARISSRRTISASKAFYDPLKDYMSLNRAMRKEMDDIGEALQPIKVEKDYRTIDILAIYK